MIQFRNDIWRRFDVLTYLSIERDENTFIDIRRILVKRLQWQLREIVRWYKIFRLIILSSTDSKVLIANLRSVQNSDRNVHLVFSDKNSWRLLQTENHFWTFSRFLNPNCFFQFEFYLIVLIHLIWETSRNKSKKHFFFQKYRRFLTFPADF